mmetsp:Transcript_24264/g.47084  ORF Transcript_24264/g.47084 Transcript_24264/m.47084 type:complete len:259 (-) Transcript_24264:294-1070(-)
MLLSARLIRRLIALRRPFPRRSILFLLLPPPLAILALLCRNLLVALAARSGDGANVGHCVLTRNVDPALGKPRMEPRPVQPTVLEVLLGVVDRALLRHAHAVALLDMVVKVVTGAKGPLEAQVRKHVLLGDRQRVVGSHVRHVRRVSNRPERRLGRRGDLVDPGRDTIFVLLVAHLLRSFRGIINPTLAGQGRRHRLRSPRVARGIVGHVVTYNVVEAGTCRAVEQCNRHVSTNSRARIQAQQQVKRAKRSLFLKVPK